MDPEISIIIINYKTPLLTEKCIASIYNASPENIPEIIVVDNCSGDDSEARITSVFPDIIWINNPVNSGFGRANNLGALHARGRYLLLLNSDIIVNNNTITNCLEFIKNNPDVGVIGCKLINEDCSLQKSVYHYIGDYKSVLQNNLIIDYFFKIKPGKIKAVMGAFMMIPTEVFLKVKGFDPDFFMYAEELDLCHRIHKAGYNIYYKDDVTAYHKHGASSTGNSWSGKQNFLSNALLFLKVRGIMGYLIYHFLYLSTFVMNVALLWKMDKTYRKDYWEDQKKYFANFGYYFIIPFLYSKSMGNGRRLLKRA